MSLGFSVEPFQRLQKLGVRWQSEAVTPLSECSLVSQRGVARRFPPHSKPGGCVFAPLRPCVKAFDCILGCEFDCAYLSLSQPSNPRSRRQLLLARWPAPGGRPARALCIPAGLCSSSAATVELGTTAQSDPTIP